MKQSTTMVLFYLMWFCVAVKAAPIHQLEGEALDLAKQNGFLSDDYDKLHVTELLENVKDSLHKLDLERIHKRNETKEKTKLNLPINGINYSLSLVHPRPVLDKKAQIIVAHGSESESNHSPVVRSCHLVGNVDGHNGSVSLSYCDRLRGSIVTGDAEYILEPLKDGRHLVAEKRKPKNEAHDYLEFLKGDERYFNSGPEVELETAEKEVRNINPVIIELAVYCDEDMTALLEKAKADTIQKKVDYILSKFNGVQYEYEKIEQLRKRVIFKIKKMVFFKTNPDWLRVNNKLGSILGPLCKNTHLLPYDIIYMITGHSPIYPVGLTYVGGACNVNYRCGVSMGTSWGRYVAIAHEIGHLLGMNHDYQTECKTLPLIELGLMGGKGTDFSNCSTNDFHNFLKTPSAKCLFTQNIPDDDIMIELKDKQLGHIPSVSNVTHHKYCENLMGIGYRYREKEGMKYSCDRGYYCVQLKEGPSFGLIYQEKAQGIVGMYCAPGKVCLKRQCLTYKLMTLHTNFLVRAGGWGQWSEWTQCSRSCGTGVKYSHRECNKPSPIQHRYCDGNEYEAELCNTKPCAHDWSSGVIKARADEVCQRLVKGNFLNPAVYNKTGQVYGIKGYNDVCDVHCNNSKYRWSRDAIMPDGTPCSSPDPEASGYNDENVHMHCFRGKCQIFGCNGEFPAKVFGASPECKDGNPFIG